MIKPKHLSYDLQKIKNHNISDYIYHDIFEIIGSTQTYIKENLDILSNKSVILTKKQTNGRGRYDRKFISNLDCGIYCSFLLKNDITHLQVTHLPLKIACALHDTLENVFGVDTLIKWPNDLYLNNKKIAGILIETSYHSSGQLEGIIIGFGLNVYKQDFPIDLKNSVSSLEEEYLSTYDRNNFIAYFFNHLDSYLNHPSIIELYKRYMFPIGTEVLLSIHQEKERVSILDVNDLGQLIIQTKDKQIKTLTSEEIILK